MKITITDKNAIRKHYEKTREIIEKTAMPAHKETALLNEYKEEAAALAKFDIEGGRLVVNQIGLDWDF